MLPPLSMGQGEVSRTPKDRRPALKLLSLGGDPQVNHPSYTDHGEYHLQDIEI